MLLRAQLHLLPTKHSTQLSTPRLLLPPPLLTSTTQHSQHASCHRATHVRVRASNVSTATTTTQPSSPSSADDDENFGLLLPDTHHQKTLDADTRRALKTKANTAAREKTLMYIQAGQNGLTQSFLAATMDLLGKYELVRLRLPDGLDKKKVVGALERLLDCVCVHHIGFTVTLYRKQGLPRPSNCPPNAQPSLNARPVEASSEEHDLQGVNPRQRIGQGRRVSRASKPSAQSRPAARGRQQDRQRGGEPQRPQFDVLS